MGNSINSTTVLEIKDLQVQFQTQEGPVPAVAGLSLRVSSGEIVGLVGESGCGKSTTALAINRLLPKSSRISGGQILLDGQDILALNERNIRKLRGSRIAMVFQDALAALDPTMHIGEQIMEPLQLHLGMSKGQARKRALELLEMVGIVDPIRRLHQYSFEFSGGMRQRVMIAIALSCNPRLLLADEPTTALDVTIQRQILNLLVQLRNSLDGGIILITHDVGVVSEVCDSVVVMYAGREVEYGPTQQVFTRPRHPYTKGLLGSTLQAATDRSQPLYAIPGLPPNIATLPAGCPFAPRCPLATEICREKVPEIQQVEQNHNVACWHSNEV
jgi:oligopeptide/dipeptide ABC transporter ATP-binding protein